MALCIDLQSDTVGPLANRLPIMTVVQSQFFFHQCIGLMYHTSEPLPVNKQFWWYLVLLAQNLEKTLQLQHTMVGGKKDSSDFWSFKLEVFLKGGISRIFKALDLYWSNTFCPLFGLWDSWQCCFFRRWCSLQAQYTWPEMLNCKMHHVTVFFASAVMNSSKVFWRRSVSEQTR